MNYYSFSNYYYIFSFAGRLIVILEEPDETPLDNVLVEVSDSASNQSRRINLVLGRTFHLRCQAGREEGSSLGGARGGTGSLDAVWYSGDSEVAVSSPSDPNRPMIYSYSDGDVQMLVLTRFTGGDVGVYRCRERGTNSGQGAAIVIGTSE